jgi:hypothetical protein
VYLECLAHGDSHDLLEQTVCQDSFLQTSV